MSSDWLAGPGQFWILGLGWGSVIAFYLGFSWKMGKVIGNETDGCLLMFCNFLFVIVGGMGGLRFFRFPYNLLCSLFAALILPSIVTLMWHLRTQGGKRP